MYPIPDHPVIRNCERTGYPDGRDPVYPRCPVCGDECSEIYETKEDELIGCDTCAVLVRQADDMACDACGNPVASVLYKAGKDPEAKACEDCVQVRDAWEYDACFPDRAD